MVRTQNGRNASASNFHEKVSSSSERSENVYAIVEKYFIFAPFSFLLHNELRRFLEIFQVRDMKELFPREIIILLSFQCSFLHHAIWTEIRSLLANIPPTQRKNYLPYLSPLKTRIIVIVDVCYKHYTTFRAAPYDSEWSTERRSKESSDSCRTERQEKEREREKRIYNCFRKKKNCHVLWIRMLFLCCWRKTPFTRSRLPRLPHEAFRFTIKLKLNSIKGFFNVRFMHHVVGATLIFPLLHSPDGSFRLKWRLHFNLEGDGGWPFVGDCTTWMCVSRSFRSLWNVANQSHWHKHIWLIVFCSSRGRFLLPEQPKKGIRSQYGLTSQPKQTTSLE